MSTEVNNSALLDLSKLSAKELAALAKQKEEQEQKERQQSREAYEVKQFRLVESLAAEAQALHDKISAMKAKWESEMLDFTDFLRTYSHRDEEWKGNMKLLNKDQTLRVEYSHQQVGDFDGRANEGAQLVLNFIGAELSDKPQVLKMVRSLLEPKSGKFDRDNILKLLAMEDDYTDERWRRGLQLLKESYTPTGTKAYIRVYKRADNKAMWEPINLNIANV